MAEDLTGKLVVVTGGNSGIGAATLEAFRVLGATGLSVDINGDGAGRLDVTIAAAVKKFADHVASSYGRCDYLIKSAGIVRVGSATELTEDDWIKHLLSTSKEAGTP